MNLIKYTLINLINAMIQVTNLLILLRLYLTQCAVHTPYIGTFSSMVGMEVEVVLALLRKNNIELPSVYSAPITLIVYINIAR